MCKEYPAHRCSDRYGFDVADVEVIRETDKAICVWNSREFRGEAWIPKSQIHVESEVSHRGQSGMLIVKCWFAKQLGLVVEAATPKLRKTNQ